MGSWEDAEVESQGTSDVPEPTVEQLEEIVWGEINAALSRPVQKDEHPINYIPTQILAELFKVNGADGIAYKSSVKRGGHNVALFDLSAAELVSGRLYSIEEIKYSFGIAGSTWVKREKE